MKVILAYQSRVQIRWGIHPYILQAEINQSALDADERQRTIYITQIWSSSLDDTHYMQNEAQLASWLSQIGSLGQPIRLIGEILRKIWKLVNNSTLEVILQNITQVVCQILYVPESASSSCMEVNICHNYPLFFFNCFLKCPALHFY